MEKIKNILTKSQNKQTLQTKNENSENDNLIPKKRQKAEEKVNDIKKKLVSFTDCIQKTKKSKKQLLSVEQTFTNYLRNKRYWDACDYIFNHQQHDKYAYLGYKMVADDMWNTVRVALAGDNSQTEHLNSVAACVKWAKEVNLTYEAEFSPNSWAKDLENIFIQYIKENIPTVKYDTDFKINLENHLEELKSKSLQQVNMTRSLLGDLYPLYLKCFTHYMHDHLSIVASNQFNFEEYALLYRWANKEWNRQLAYQHETEDFDHLLFKKWFENTGEKIIHTGKQTIIKVLTEILQREMDWNSYLKTELSYYFNDISKELDKVTNAVKDLGDTLRSGIKILCWDELDNFIKRYNTFLKNKIDKTVSLNEVHVILRSVKNCQILRKAQENLGNAPENKNDLNNKITESETHVIKQLPSALKSSLKRAFEKYFENNSTEFENILEKLQPEIAQIQNNEMIIKIIHCTVVALYIQTFINYYMETSHSNVSEIFSKGSKHLQNCFKALVPVTVKLDNPMEFISQILESKDTGTESLEVTTCAFVYQHPDLREEHLKAIMDIKGDINWKQREKLLYFVKEQKAPTPDDQMLFFNEVEVKFSWWNRFCCCCCCC